MNRTTLIGFLIIAFGLEAALFLSRISQAESQATLISGPLQPCPGSPNCVSTEEGDEAPIALDGQSPQQAWALLQQAVEAEGGRLSKVMPDYLSATFQTPLLKFTDDVEARLDQANRLIHLRSASRVGYYDFGTNRKRLRAIKARLQRSPAKQNLKNRHE
jgi:uncharacterized protein (DUF1499 family)